LCKIKLHTKVYEQASHPPMTLNGPGATVVEINESLFRHKPKAYK